VLTQDSGLGDGWAFNRFSSIDQYVFASAASTQIPVITSALPLDEHWHFLAIRVSPERSQIWCDGRWVKEGAIPIHSPPVRGPLVVGNSSLGNAPWDGDLLDLRIHGRLLSESEILALQEQPRSNAKPLPRADVLVPPETVHLQSGRRAEYRSQQWTTIKGLPSPHVQSVLQRRNGALWLGFEEGLVSFDGRRFDMTDGTAPEFADTGSDVICMTEDFEGALWMGLFRGLVRRDGGSSVAITNWAPARFVMAVTPATGGGVWVSSVRDELPRGSAQLWRIEGAGTTPRWIAALPGQVRSLWQGEDALWAATDEPSALWRVSLTNGIPEVVVHMAVQSVASEEGRVTVQSLVRRAISAAGQTVQARVWTDADSGDQWSEVSMEGGGKTWSWQRRANLNWEWGNVVRDHPSDAEEAGWFITPQGLVRGQGSTWERVPLESRRPETMGIHSLVPSQEGGVWVATESDGLWLVNRPAVQVVGNVGGLPQNRVISVALHSGGDLMAGLDQEQLAFLDPALAAAGHGPHLITPAGALSSSFTHGMVFSTHWRGGFGPMVSQGNSMRGLIMVRTNGSYPNPSAVSQVHVARDGSPWLVDSQGVYQFLTLPPLEPTVSFHSVEGVNYRKWDLAPGFEPKWIGIAEDDAGGLWIGSGGHGLFHISGEKIAHFPDTESPPESLCVPLGFSDDGTLWLGSEAGLGAWRGGKYHWIRTAHGLPESVVCHVEEAEGYVWFVGRRGIHGIRRAELEEFFQGRTHRVSPISLTRSDGFPSGQASLIHQPGMVKSPDGRLWVVASGGLAHFDPREVLRTLRPPPIAIDELTSNSQPVPLDGARAVLPPGGGRVVELAFSSPSFSAPQLVRFHYEVTGPETHSSKETEAPYAVLTHLPYGRYEVKVTARSGNGLESHPAARLVFDIQPYFFQTVWFRCLAIGAFFGTAAGLVSRRIHRVRQSAQVEQELRLEAERRRIAQNMHDELGAELMRFILRARGPKLGDPGAAIGEGETDLRKVLRVLDETVWVVNPSKDSLESVVGYLESWVRDYFSGTGIAIRSDLPPRVSPVSVSSEWRHHVLRIVKEACCNVVKHAQASQVRFAFRVSEDGRAVEVEICDDGCGFSPGPADGGSRSEADRLGGNGLVNLRDRAGELGGHLEVHSAPGEGTCLRIQVPIRTLPK
ncbi:MAG: ATP-binding protein, partial [Verrucomicrobiae bacterium]|nr:ATP-binding protein [Verrucomicrobiae bacterium]